METAEVRGPKKRGHTPPTLEGNCTVGVFLTRLKVDHVRDGEEAVYRFAVIGPDSREAEGRAEVVAVGG